ncbi:MAG: T9SS type A sorting domain-containing protein [Ignavibacteriales bacterium]|nr:T9SS type A sorting domain-containing protein [Ignavibacteriales bacterium]
MVNTKPPSCYQTETIYGHPGEAYGLISDAYYSFDRRYGIVFITNGGQWGYGAYSGWYDVEEDVFQACLSELNNLTNVQQEENVPAGFSLLQNYPNPFNPATTIVYTLPETAYVKITVFNSLGEEIKQLTNIELPAGSHSVYFKPDNLPSGTYLYRITALTNTGVMYNSERKMIYLR